MVMERFLWQSYPQHLQNTLFHADRIAPLRKKSLQDRLEEAYTFKGKGDAKLEDGKYREAQLQYEFAYGMFKYCEKQGRKITMRDDTKSARDMREERMQNGGGERDSADDAFDKFWLEVDMLMSVCLTLMAVSKMNYRNPLLEEALAAANEAVEFRPDHAAALYRRSQVHEKLEMWGDAVADARAAYECAPEDLRFELWRHQKHAIETRRANSLFWGFMGFMGDLPRNIVRLPWTLGEMPPMRRNLIVFFLSLCVGLYRLPAGTLPELYTTFVGAPSAPAPPAVATLVDNMTNVTNASLSANASGQVVAEAGTRQQKKQKKQKKKKEKQAGGGGGFFKGVLKVFGGGGKGKKGGTTTVAVDAPAATEQQGGATAERTPMAIAAKGD